MRPENGVDIDIQLGNGYFIKVKHLTNAQFLGAKRFRRG